MASANHNGDPEMPSISGMTCSCVLARGDLESCPSPTSTDTTGETGMPVFSLMYSNSH